MPPKKNINKRNNAGEGSAHANKRRRNEVLNATTGVPFTNPMTEFPSGHLLRQQPVNNNHLPPPQNTTVTTILQPTPPVSLHPYTSFTDLLNAPAEDDQISSLITQQNFMICAEVNKMRLSMEEFWRKNYAGEIKKRQEIEAMIKQKDDAESRFLQMLQFYQQRAANLQEQLQRMVVSGEGSSGSGSAPVEEEVISSFRDRKTAPATDMSCKYCGLHPATMLWYPCRHLCVCSMCDSKICICPICFRRKSSSCMLNLPWL